MAVPPSPKRTSGPKTWSWTTLGEQLGAAVGERLHDHAGQQVGESGLQIPVGGADLGVAAQIEVDGVLCALVQESGPVGLHDHPAVGAAQPVGGQDGVVLGLGPGPRQLRDAVAVEELGAHARVEPAAVRVRVEVGLDDRVGPLGLDAVEVGDGPGGPGEPGRTLGRVGQRPCRGLGFGVRRNGAAVRSGQQLDGQGLFEAYRGDRLGPWSGDGGPPLEFIRDWGRMRARTRSSPVAAATAVGTRATRTASTPPYRMIRSTQSVSCSSVTAAVASTGLPTAAPSGSTASRSSISSGVGAGSWSPASAQASAARTPTPPALVTIATRGPVEAAAGSATARRLPAVRPPSEWR